MVNSYKFTDAFKKKHICVNASRADVINMAQERGVACSTLIRCSAAEVENKALSICQQGDNNQVAAAITPNFGLQLYVRLTKIPIASYNNKGLYERNDEGKFIVVGNWRKDVCEGNHFEANYKDLPQNNEELFPPIKKRL